MATCGACHQEGQTVEHIQACFKERWATTTKVEPITGAALRYAQDYYPNTREQDWSDDNFR